MQLKNLSILPSTYTSLLRDVKKQRKFVKKILDPDIAKASAKNDGSLDEEDFNKIRGYYGFGVPAIVGEGFCTLRGEKMSTTERLASSYQGALTGLYDDFFDKTGLAQEGIRQMMDSPDSYAPATSLEKLFIHFLKNTHANLPDNSLFNHYFDKVFTAQIESKKQLDASIETAEIKEITFNKGGNSLLFYRSVFMHELRQGEEDALFNTGALMQLGNDIFDVYKDDRAGIMTLPSACTHIDEVRQEFISQLDKCISLVGKLDYEKKSIKRYLNKLLLGVSRCFIALDQLEKLQDKTDGKFNPSAYSRNELICDMEKPKNMIRSMRYFTGFKF